MWSNVQADNDLRRFLAARSLLTPQVLLSWWFLTIPENCWRFLTIPDNCWQLLTIPYNCWQLLQHDHLHRRTIRTRAQASNKLPRKNIFSDEGGNIVQHCNIATLQHSTLCWWWSLGDQKEQDDDEDNYLGSIFPQQNGRGRMMMTII